MTAVCISPIQGTRYRLVRESACGVPVTGAGSQIVSDGFVEILVSPQYEDGTEYRLANARGNFCVNTDGDDRMIRADVDMRFCSINPDEVVITTGVTLVTTGAPATGTGFWATEGLTGARFSLEAWAADPDTCTGLQARYAYWAFPHLSSGRLNDFAVKDDVIEWRVKAKTRKANTLWGSGPGTVKYINQVPATAHWGFNIVSIDPPAATGPDCGAQTL